MGNEETIECTLQAYARAVALADPGRLERWVGLGLTITQLRVLFLLRREVGVPAGFLADRLRVTPSTLTRIVDRLVRLHLVRRQEDPDDRRLVRHYLTAEGDHALAEMERTGRAFLVAVLERLPPHKLERLLHALEDLSQAADAVEDRATASGEW
jgi:DNA-binding MarR family transcriptional regulator